MKKISIIIGLCIVSIFTNQLAFSQVDPAAFGYYSDALRYSQISFGGTARFQAIGGANVALGGDISSAHINPAGLGFNRRSEFTLTPTLGFNNASAGVFGNNVENTKLNLNFNSFGMVFASPSQTNSKFRGGSFAISFTRLNDFQDEFIYRGVSNETSIVDFFLDQTDGQTSWGVFDDQLDNGELFSLNAMAYSTFLINPDFEFDNGNENLYFSFIPPVQTEIQEVVTNTGGQNQWNFAYGGNYDDRLYFGVNLGVQSIRFQQEREYSEFTLDSSPLSSITVTDRLTTTGAGVNLTAGLVFRVNDAIRLGVSGTTPTAIRLSETFTTSLNVQYNDFTYRVSDFIEDPVLRAEFENDPEFNEFFLSNENAQAVPIETDYTLITPYRLNAGMSVFLGKSGFLTGDVELVGYQNAELTGGADSGIIFDADNRTIENLYDNALNIRLGGEFRFDDIRLRAGYARYDTPFVEEGDISRVTNNFSGGIGLRKQDYYLDFTIVHTAFDNAYSPYSLASGLEPNVNLQFAKTKALVSFGVFF